MKKLAWLMTFALILTARFALATDAEPCFIECNAGCRISQGADYPNSKYIYEEMSFEEWIKFGFGIEPPDRPSVFVKLKELQKDKICGSAAVLGKCTSEEIHSKYHFGNRILIDGENGRHVEDVSNDELESVLQNLVDLGQCTRESAAPEKAPQPN